MDKISPRGPFTPREIATGDRRTAAVRHVVDELLANAALPATSDRAKAIFMLSTDVLTQAGIDVCDQGGIELDPENMLLAEGFIAADLLYRALEARDAERGE